jgi:hypothetical protein
MNGDEPIVKVGKFCDHAWGLRRRISLRGCWVEQDVRGMIFLPQMPIPPDQIDDLVMCELKAQQLARDIDNG